MRCKTEHFVSGNYFHFYNKTLDHRLLFYDASDYEDFIKIFRSKISKIPASIFAYCLMPNHFHFLLRQDSDNKLFHIFNYALISYVQRYNKKYGRKGPLFQSPLQHILVTNQEYMLQLCKYIHLNPVKSGLVNEPSEWKYSNYAEWIGISSGDLIADEVHSEYFPDPHDYIMLLASYEQYLPVKGFKALLMDNDE
jgi:putative transposase